MAAAQATKTYKQGPPICSKAEAQRKPETHANSDDCLEQGWATGKEDTQTATPQPGTTFGAHTEKHRHRNVPV